MNSLTNMTKAQLIALIEGNTNDVANILALETSLETARECYRAQRSEIAGLQKLLAEANPTRVYKATRALTGAALTASQAVKSRAAKIGEASSIVKQLILSAASAESIEAAKLKVREAISS